MHTKFPAILVALTCLGLVAADKQTSESLAEKEALSQLQSYIGVWRGVGQPRRGSTRGSWTEQCDWAWNFAGDKASLVFQSPKGKYFRSGKLLPGDKSGSYKLVVKTTSDKDIEYSGQLDKDNKLVLLPKEVVEGLPARISVRLVAEGKRMLVLYERKSGASDRFYRLAEVGFTRKGSNFGKGTAYVECVVTGGKGTIAVTHKGKTYYVCCTGCRDLFNEDPETVLAEYRERKAAEKKKKP